MSEKPTLLQRFMSRTDCTDEVMAYDYLESAKSIVLNRRHPYGDLPEEVEPRYIQTQLEIAEYLYLKRGAEGQIHHTENGVNRQYDSPHVPDALLNEITPLVKIY